MAVHIRLIPTKHMKLKKWSQLEFPIERRTQTNIYFTFSSFHHGICHTPSISILIIYVQMKLFYYFSQPNHTTVLHGVIKWFTGSHYMLRASSRHIMKFNYFIGTSITYDLLHIHSKIWPRYIICIRFKLRLLT